VPPRPRATKKRDIKDRGVRNVLIINKIKKKLLIIYIGGTCFFLLFIGGTGWHGVFFLKSGTNTKKRAPRFFKIQKT
jgi:hypothetical protein